MADSEIAEQLVQAAHDLAIQADRLCFGPPIKHVYNPLSYAWDIHQAYLRRYGNSRKRVVFWGMNPGPFGMVQTGVPFGEVSAVRDWLGLSGRIEKPVREHSARPIQGFDCHRSEVSGERLWGLFAKRFGPAPSFFRDHLVMNYCPLAFLEESGRNYTPNHLPARQAAPLLEICDHHLFRVCDALRPEWLVGIGDFATRRLRAGCERTGVKIGQILHPSPASPLANKDWAATATKQLIDLGLWPSTVRPDRG